MALVLKIKKYKSCYSHYIQNINKKASAKDKNSVVFNFPEKQLQMR
jgi:hypothetical protein